MPHSYPTVYLVEEHANPSTDFFVLPALLAYTSQIKRCRFADLPAASDMHGALVVFVRYMPSNWVKLITATRQHLAGFVLFIDDDVLDFAATSGLPWSYRFKLARLITRRRQWLQQQNVQLWVSTTYLQQKYADWQPRLVLPSPIAPVTNHRRVFYHGSIATHQAEIRWLRPIIAELLRRDERVTFELVGKRDVLLLYKDVPRVTVIHPLKWPAYQTFLNLGERHIGLNPLQQSPFNAARSYTKFFDITHCGAVGIYAADSACAEVVSHDIDGLILPQDQDAWLNALLRLVADEPLRQTLLHNAQRTVLALQQRAQAGYTALHSASSMQASSF